MTKEEHQLRFVEVTRSFSYKLNCGNYESRDFFCSQKSECSMEEAEQKSQALHDFCKAQVMKAVNAYISEEREKRNTASQGRV